jgi:hypothetical protein
MNDFKKYLFNFSASPRGGGFKRLYAFANFFNKRGGSNFLIHPSCLPALIKFKKNNFIVIKQNILIRFFNDSNYLNFIAKSLGGIDFYYSYGIPIYKRVAKLNWFHLSNILPIISLKNIPVNIFTKLKMHFLGIRILDNLVNADIISAESNFSLNKLDFHNVTKNKLFLSSNGCDDELKYFGQKFNKRNFVLVIGTYSYKSLKNSFKVFLYLNKMNQNDLILKIAGPSSQIPSYIRNHKNVRVLGEVSRRQITNLLKKCKVYISTTYIENSFNAASEGIYFANESFISDIPPHNELLDNIGHKKIIIPGVSMPMLHIIRDNLSIKNIKSWEILINEMLDKVKSIQKKN